VPRTLHLDGTPLLESWAAKVREAAEAMLAVDASGRLVALSPLAAKLLGLDPAAAVGVMLLDLVEVVDFTSAAVPVPDPDVQLPPLRAIVTGRLNRGLVRLRTGHGLCSYDVVGIPLSDAAGAVAFLATI
jgi:PAS domain-containing protein